MSQATSASETAEAAQAVHGSEVRWGVLSTANIGIKAVLPAIRAARNGRLVAIASRAIERAQGLAAREPGARVYGSYEALLADPEVDAVYIPLPNGLHAEWAIRAAEQGKHVLCEKPLGITAAEVERMFAVFHAHQRLLMEAFMYRFHPQIRWVQEQVRIGRIGRVQLVRGGFAFDIRSRPHDVRLQASLSGGSLMDVGGYPLSFSRAIFGCAPLDAAARVQVPGASEVELSTAAVLDYGDDRMALIDCSFAQPAHQFAEVVGSDGRIVLPRPYTPGLSEAVVRLELGSETIERRFTAVDQYQLEVEHFGDCVLTGATPDLTEHDALEQARAIDLVYARAGYRWPR